MTYPIIKPQVYNPETVKPYDLNLKNQSIFLTFIDEDCSLKVLRCLFKSFIERFRERQDIALVLVFQSVEWLMEALNPLLEEFNFQSDGGAEIIILNDIEASDIPSLLAACDVYLDLNQGSLTFLLRALCMERQVVSVNTLMGAAPLIYINPMNSDTLGQVLEEVLRADQITGQRAYFLRNYFNETITSTPDLEQISKLFYDGHYNQAANMAEVFLQGENVSFDALFKCIQIFVNTDRDEQAQQVFDRLEGVLEGIREKFQIYLDPTQMVPYVHTICTKERADQVYKDAFRRCFEYIQGSRMTGSILEFGTYLGYTARLMATLMNELEYEGKLYLYDSFQGLPPVEAREDQVSYEVAVHKVWEQGQLDVPPEVPKQIVKALRRLIPEQQFSLIHGFFEDTLPAELPSVLPTLVHIDSDLYSSALFVLSQLLEKQFFQDGTLIVFDDFNCNHANPQLGERKALIDAFSTQTRYSYSQFFSYGWHGQVFFVHDQEKFKGR